MQSYKVSDNRHAARHALGGDDPLPASDIDAAPVSAYWTANTDYRRGQVVVDSNNVAYVAGIDFTSDAVFAEDNLIRIGVSGSTVVKVNGISPDGSGNVQLGTAASRDTGGAEGNVPLLGIGGKLLTSQIPTLAITETYTATSEAEMVALVAEQGDICIRTDVSSTYILTNNDPSQAANWTELSFGAGGVLSINGLTGAVVLGASDVNADDAGAAATAQVNAQAYTDSIAARKDNNLSDLADAVVARTNLGLGSAAQLNAIVLNAADAVPGGTPAGTVIIRKLV